MALTKADIAMSLSKEADLQFQDAKDMVDNFFEELRITLESGVQIKLSGFGNFELKDKAARPGRNPKTGVEVEITPRRVVTFKSGQKLKARMEKLVGREEGGDSGDQAGDGDSGSSW